MPAFNFFGRNFAPNGTGYMEFGNGTYRNLPFRVDQDGNVTGANIIPSAGMRVLQASGSADDVQINAAASSFGPFGGLVLLTPGVYSMNSPAVLPGGVTLASVTGNVDDKSQVGAVLQRSNTWAQGGAPLKAMVVATGLDAQVRNISIDVAFPADTIDGINSTTACLQVEDVSIYNGPNNGLGSGVAWRVHRVIINQAYNYGFNGVGTDSTYEDCISNEAQVWNWFVQNPINSKVVNCRAEFSAPGSSGGMLITGDNTATGGFQLDGFSTDRNDGDGIQISGSGFWPINITNLNCRRDGSNGTGKALNILANTSMPVNIAGFTVFPGFFDNGTGTQSPITGVAIGAGCRYVGISQAYVHAVTTPVSGTFTSNRALATANGNWFSPSAVTLVADSA